MPAFLVLFDHILMQNEFERIHLFLKTARTPPCPYETGGKTRGWCRVERKKAAGGFSYVEKKQFEAETKALEDTEMTETGGSQEKTDSDAEAREKHRRKLRLLGKVRERRKDRKRKMTEKGRLEAMKKIIRRGAAATLAAVTLVTSAAVPVRAAAPRVQVDETMYVNLDYYGTATQINVVKRLYHEWTDRIYRLWYL